MLTIKNTLSFLQECYNSDVKRLTPLATGMFSHAFSFWVGEKAFVVRFNQFEQDFLKDKYAYEYFACKDIPIPPIIQLGKYNDTWYYAISPLCPGQTLDKLSAEQMHALLPDLITTVNHIHSIDLSDHPGYGLMDEHGTGMFSSWQESIMSLDNRKINYDWHHLLHKTFLEKDFFLYYKQEMLSLIPDCPEEKQLVHGDIGFDNVICDGKKITGVLDWAESKIGDPLWDVAWLNFWSDEIDYANKFYHFYKCQNQIPQNYKERLRCYSLHISLTSLAIAAHNNNYGEYKRVKKRMKNKIIFFNVVFE